MAGKDSGSPSPTKTRKRRRRIIPLLILLFVVLPALAVGLVNWLVIRAAGPHIRPLDELPHAQAAIVLGARVWHGGQPSATLADRIDGGIALYQAGLVDKILLSGDHGQHTYDEVNAMRRRVLDAGVPPDDVFLDHAGFSTYQTMYRARDVFEVRTAIIVTQRFHLARSVYTARQLGLDATGYAADRRRYRKAAKNALRETLARCKAVAEVLVLRPEPRYLGDVIPITGDGRATWDEDVEKTPQQAGEEAR